VVESRGRNRRVEEGEERRVGRRSRLVVLLTLLLLRRRKVAEKGEERGGMLRLRLRLGEMVRGVRVVRLVRR